MLPTALVRRQHVVLALLIASAIMGLVAIPDTWHRGLHAVVDAPWFPVLLVFLFLIRPFFAVPLAPFSILIGWQYGLLGVPFVLLGTVITCLPPFLIARHLDSSLLGLRHLTASSRYFFTRTSTSWGMVIARLSPAPADAVSYSAGLATVPLRAFILGTLLGELPWATAYVLLGHTLNSRTALSYHLDYRIFTGLTLITLVLFGWRLYITAPTD